MKNNLSKYGISAWVYLAYMLPLLAFPGDPDSYENEDEAQSPIDNWEMILIFAAISLGIYFLQHYRKRQEVS